ncbi:hypothetical protein GJV26_23115 [Massilia dura]|uniref:Uncharacterized protein n=1 Tax=Pseudoduganella dura TaxID=321982 RepID=A0A6I3XUC1_9BURK|nr:hypothetical protein [Pseudoduganella dura]MUI15325.1 hypothetical protein [Pseudoduganella dura]
MMLFVEASGACKSFAGRPAMPGMPDGYRLVAACGREAIACRARHAQKNAGTVAGLNPISVGKLEETESMMTLPGQHGQLIVAIAVIHPVNERAMPGR